MKELILIVLGAAVLAGCSSGSGSNSSSNSESYSYEITYNNCPTGKHSFSSKDELCAGLKDDHLNGYCARQMRKQEFADRSCPGSFDSSPIPTTSPVQTAEPTSPPPSPSNVGSGSNVPTTSGAAGSVHQQPVPPKSAKEAMAGWKQKLVVRSQKFMSDVTSPCSDFLCLAARTGGSGSMKMDPQHPDLAIQKFWVLWAPGVVLECQRSGAIVSAGPATNAKATCQLSVDPSQSSATTRIRVSDQYSVPVVSIEFSHPPLVYQLIEKTLGLGVMDREEVTITEKASGQEKKTSRMNLECGQADAANPTCTLTAVVQVP